MLRRLRPRSIYDVFAVLALVVAVGGTGAYAANTVFSSDIADGEVQSADVKDNSLNTFDVQTFLGADVVNNTLTGDDVDESTLKLAAEPWHEVSAFSGTASCVWSNFDTFHNSAAYTRDRAGFVHLKGLVDADDGPSGPCGTSGFDPYVFTLPAGYRPSNRNVLAVISNDGFGRLSIEASGQIRIDSPTTWVAAKAWVSLDGIEFRCAPAGVNGCP